MAETKQQHYVPQFHLRQWSNKRQHWRIGVFDKTSDRIFQSSTRNVGGEKYFYHERGEPQEFEKILAKMEAWTDALYRRIQESGAICWFSKADCLLLGMHVATLDARTRERRTFSNQVQQSVLDSIVKRLGVKGWRLRLPRGMDRFLQMESVARAMSDPYVLDHLEPALLVNESDLAFTTSDHPVVRHNDHPPAPGGGGRLGLLNRGIQLHLAISPTLAVLLYDRTAYPDVPRVVACNREYASWLRAETVRTSFAQIFGRADDDFALEQDVVAESPEVAFPDRLRIMTDRYLAAPTPSDGGSS